MNTRLTEIGKELGELYRRRIMSQLRERQITTSIDEQKFYLTPIDGWPGKNEEARKLDAARCYAQDEIIQTKTLILDDLKAAMAVDDGMIMTLEAERRALEWEISLTLATALSGNRQDHGDVAETAFDDATQGEMDKLLDGKPADFSEFHDTPPTATYDFFSPDIPATDPNWVPF